MQPVYQRGRITIISVLSLLHARARDYIYNVFT